jgi:hypothetical protein
MKEALKLALEALELVSIEFVCNGAHHAKKDRHDWLESCPIVERYQAAITAIKEALAQDEKGLFIDLIAQHEGLAEELAQPEQEPVCEITVKNGHWIDTNGFSGVKDLANGIHKLYTTPPKRPSEQEPVAPTCERCADEIVENNAGLCANCLPAICTEQEPVFKWCSVFQEMPTEDSHLLFCFGVHVVEGSYTKKGWASLAYGEAQPDFWAHMPPPPHHKRNQELYAMPPKRPWVGLTDEEIGQWIEEEHDVLRWAEAKLKELNT